MHRACFLGWELRETFVARYNAEIGSITWGDGTYHDTQPDGTIRSRQRNNSVWPKEAGAGRLSL